MNTELTFQDFKSVHIQDLLINVNWPWMWVLAQICLPIHLVAGVFRSREWSGVAANWNSWITKRFSGPKSSIRIKLAFSLFHVHYQLTRRVCFIVYLYDLGYLPEKWDLIRILNLVLPDFWYMTGEEPVTSEIKRLFSQLPWKFYSN